MNNEQYSEEDAAFEAIALRQQQQQAATFKDPTEEAWDNLKRVVDNLADYAKKEVAWAKEYRLKKMR